MALPSPCVGLCWVARFSRTHGRTGQGCAEPATGPAVASLGQGLTAPGWGQAALSATPLVHSGSPSPLCTWGTCLYSPLLLAPCPVLSSWAACTRCSSLILHSSRSAHIKSKPIPPLAVIFLKEASFSISSHEISPWPLNTGGQSALWHPNEVLLEHCTIRGISTCLSLLEIPQNFGLVLPFFESVLQ